MAANKTAVSILTEARDSIKKATWICGALDACTVNKKGTFKHMACAIGIVSLAAGGKAVRKTKQRVLVNGKWLNSQGEFDYGYSNDFVTLEILSATYPDKNWSKAAKEAALFLALAIPVDTSSYAETAKECAAGKEEQWEPVQGYHTVTIDPLSEKALKYYTNAVTEHNDSFVTSAAEARKWFSQAIKLAKMGRVNALASLDAA